MLLSTWKSQISVLVLKVETFWHSVKRTVRKRNQEFSINSAWASQHQGFFEHSPYLNFFPSSAVPVIAFVRVHFRNKQWKWTLRDSPYFLGGGGGRLEYYRTLCVIAMCLFFRYYICIQPILHRIQGCLHMTPFSLLSPPTILWVTGPNLAPVASWLSGSLSSGLPAPSPRVKPWDPTGCHYARVIYHSFPLYPVFPTIPAVCVHGHALIEHHQKQTKVFWV